MKIRTGFVSNSSSSSFIVINNKNLEMKDCFKGIPYIHNPHAGELQFGWQFETYSDFFSKLNFCFIQAVANTSIDIEIYNNQISMLEEVIMEHTGAISVDFGFELNYDIFETNISPEAYIDHASSASESQNEEMFNSKEDLKNFLFSEDSYIENQNDNDV